MAAPAVVVVWNSRLSGTDALRLTSLQTKTIRATQGCTTPAAAGGRETLARDSLSFLSRTTISSCVTQDEPKINQSRTRESDFTHGHTYATHNCTTLDSTDLSVEKGRPRRGPGYMHLLDPWWLLPALRLLPRDGCRRGSAVAALPAAATLGLHATLVRLALQWAGGARSGVEKAPPPPLPYESCGLRRPARWPRPRAPG